MSTFIRCSDSGSRVFLKEGILLTRYESVGRVFESLWAHQKKQRLSRYRLSLFFLRPEREVSLQRPLPGLLAGSGFLAAIR
jgi:hypothetical protein